MKGEGRCLVALAPTQAVVAPADVVVEAAGHGACDVADVFITPVARAGHHHEAAADRWTGTGHQP